MQLRGRQAAASGLGLIAVFLVASAGVSYWETLLLVGNQRWVAHTRQVIGAIQELRATITEAETGQRGFLLTGRPLYLETFETAATRIDGLFRELGELTADNPEQKAHLAELQALAATRLAHLRHNASVRQQQGFEAAQAIVDTDEGHLLMERIRREIDSMTATEDALLGIRLAESRQALRTKNVTTVVSMLLGLAAVAFAFSVFQRALAARRRGELRQAALAELRQHALSDANVDSLMQRAVSLIARTLEAPLVKVLELLPDGHALLLRAGIGWREGLVGRARVGAGLDSQAGYTLYASRPVVVGDLTTHRPIVVDDFRKETRFSGPPLLTDHGVVSGVSVIIYDRPERPFGVLGVHTTRRRRFRSEDLAFVQSAANVLAIAMQRRRAEASLRESEGRFRALADSIPEIVWTSGPDGRCDYLNERWTEFTGIDGEEPGREGWIPALHEEDRAAAVTRWQQSLESGEPLECECRLRSRDGSYRWCLGRALPLRDPVGRIVKWFGNWMDIDQHRRMEDRLKQVDRQKNLFLATLVHELRNPLASVASVVELLKHHARADGEIQREVEVMEGQVQQLQRLVDDLLDASRAGEGKIRIERQNVELARIVHRAIEQVLPQIDARRHKLDVQMPSQPIRLRADPGRLIQVVANLVSNAARYTEPGGQITLQAERQGGEAVIRVRDTGVGIPAEALPHLFEMFVQVDRRGGAPREGLGIGLALVRKLVELHGGSVEARSEGPGLGSEFCIRLPALPDDAAAEQRGGSEAADVRAGPLRVLVVDDNEPLADSFAKLLRHEGCEVRSAGSGREALRCARELRPQVAFLDVALGDMSGYELLDRLRRQTECEDTLFVAVTGYGKEAAPRLAGFQHHLVKPVDFRAVKRLLRERPKAARDGDGGSPYARLR